MFALLSVLQPKVENKKQSYGHKAKVYIVENKMRKSAEKVEHIG